jgi:hypothetical protein
LKEKTREIGFLFRFHLFVIQIRKLPSSSDDSRSHNSRNTAWILSSQYSHRAPHFNLTQTTYFVSPLPEYFHIYNRYCNNGWFIFGEGWRVGGKNEFKLTRS